MKKIAFILSVVIVLAAGCTKEGPQGPQGPAGNANVQSFTYDATSNDWTSNDNGISWYTGLSVPEITSAVMSSGAVLVYLVDNSTATTYNFQIPYYYATASVNYTATIYVGNVQILEESTNTVAINNPGASEFRVVVIPSAGKKAFDAPKGWHLVKSIVK